MRVNPRFETLAPRSLMRVSVRVARTAFFVPMTDLDTSTPLGRAFAARSSGFLQDEVEGLDRRDFLYGGAVAVVFLIVPIVVIPTMTSTIVSAWADRALDTQRSNLRQNRPEVQESSVRVADYYRQRGVGGPELSAMTSTVLGGFVKVEAVAHSIQSGMRFLSLIVGGGGRSRRPGGGAGSRRRARTGRPPGSHSKRGRVGEGGAEAAATLYDLDNPSPGASASRHRRQGKGGIRQVHRG